jgi:hypothetical protein
MLLAACGVSPLSGDLTETIIKFGEKPRKFGLNFSAGVRFGSLADIPQCNYRGPSPPLR